MRLNPTLQTGVDFQKSSKKYKIAESHVFYFSTAQKVVYGIMLSGIKVQFNCGYKLGFTDVSEYGNGKV